MEIITPWIILPPVDDNIEKKYTQKQRLTLDCSTKQRAQSNTTMENRKPNIQTAMYIQLQIKKYQLTTTVQPWQTLLIHLEI